MLPPKELNPSDADLLGTVHRVVGEKAGMNLLERITELEARNLYLQSLVVELLDKNEQLRRKVMQEKTGTELLSQ